LLVEELLQLHTPFLPETALDITIGYSEKSERVTLLLESNGAARNVLESDTLSDDLGVVIIKNLCERIDYQRLNDKNCLECLLKAERKPGVD